MALVRINYSGEIKVCPVCNRKNCNVTIYCDNITHELSEKIECIMCESKEKKE